MLTFLISWNLEGPDVVQRLSGANEPFASALGVAVDSSGVDIKSDVGTITWWQFAWVDLPCD